MKRRALQAKTYSSVFVRDPAVPDGLTEARLSLGESVFTNF